MDKRRSVLNVSVSIFSKIILLIAALFVRRLLIQHIGNEVNGLNSLYTNIIGVLAVAELGVGSAIVFSMYAPIVAGDNQRVAALYFLIRRLYRIIGAVIFAAGIAVIPFLPRLIGDYENLDVNVYLTFFLTLISVVLSYFYSAKTSLIEAYKDHYITTGILTVSRLFRYAMQVAAILIWSSFVVFLVCQIIETMIIWLLTEIVVRQKHGEIVRDHEKVDAGTRAEISRNIKAMMMHKVGTVMTKTVDSLIISGFIGVVVLGKYSNYAMLALVLEGTLALFFKPLTAVVGHLCVTENPEHKKKYFQHFYCMNYILGVVFFLGYYAVIDYVISLCLGPDLGVSRAISFIITLNQFTQFMRSSVLLFRNASGTFYNDRWKPVAEGVANLVLSLLFVIVFSEEYKVVGVIVATIITTLLICNTVEPHVVFKHVFGQKPGIFYLRSYGYVGLFIICLFSMMFLGQPDNGSMTVALKNGIVSIGISIAALALLAAADKGFRDEIRFLAGKLVSRLRIGAKG